MEDNKNLIPQPIMSETDTNAGNLATCYVTIGDNRYYLLQLKDFAGDTEIVMAEIERIGAIHSVSRPVGAKSTFSATIYDNTDIFRDLVFQYLETGVFPPMEIQTTNYDPMSSTGRHTVIYEGCYLDKASLSKIAMGGEVLETEISGTVGRPRMPEKFKNIEGMI